MNIKIPTLYTSILYGCAFLLFLEWLYPVNEIGDVNNLTIFILYTLFCFLLSMLQIRWWISMILKGFGSVFIIHSLFLTSPLLSKQWINQLLTELAFNINALVTQQWYELTPLFRSVLFLLLIWLMSYLLYYWFIIMKRIFTFVVLTIIYIGILDTFTVYDANVAIVRIFVISFVAMGMTNFFKEMDRESIRFPWMKKSTAWILPVVAVVLFSTLIGYAAPKFNPQWPDPVPFLKSAAENAGGSDIGSTIQKVGYGNDDSRLGGSFVQDYTPVFQVRAQHENYWRVETKDVYTGKGWIKSGEPEYDVQRNNYISLETFSDQVETEKFRAILSFQDGNRMEKLIYPYGISRVETKQDVTLLLNERSGEIRTQIDNEGTPLDTYTITYEKPSFAIDKLREASMKDPQNINKRYTQLPGSLPERVGELAKEITVEEDNRYDKAQEIESYFSSNGFTYQISNVPVPEEEQDYVDQFLFESKAGYCDNYSTSMVVMLRTLDIPARWVKGFTSGEKIAANVGGTNNSYNVYEVTNANAHSWVEVYFPEIGWVPFEPTQGFSNSTEFQLNLDRAQQDDTLQAPESTETPQSQKQNQPEPNKMEEQTQSAEESTSGFTVNWWYVLIGVAVLLFIVYLLYRTRFRWKTAYLGMKLNSKNDAKTYQETYHHLLKVLNYNGFPKKPDTTLREYAHRVDSHYNTDAMRQLTSYYEQILYKNEPGEQETAGLSQLWKNLMKQIMA